jgi:hypothetical protein
MLAMRRYAKMRGFLGFAVLAGAVVALSGCDSARETFGFAKSAPDEFEVVTRAPLVIPPDYGLRPPQPGAARPQEKEIRDQARETVTGRNAAVATAASAQIASTNTAPAAGPPRTEGERALLTKAGALDADPTIRRTVDRESTLLAEADSDFIDRLIFWQDKPQPGLVVDPDAETKRIREAMAQGDAPTKGETPTIKRRKKGWLEGIF